MPGCSRRTKSTRCFQCGRFENPHMLVQVRKHSGQWSTILRLCWRCAYPELRRYAMKPAGEVIS